MDSLQQRRLIVVDVDSTFITDEQIDLLAQHAGTGAQVAAITEQAMSGELDFTASLHARVRALAGLSIETFDQVLGQVTLTEGAQTLVTAAAERQWPVALVSGGFHEIVDPLAAKYGITHVAANRLESSHDVLTGRVDGPIVDRAAKATWLRQFAEFEGIPVENTVAVGDGANDLDMLAAAGLGVAYKPKPFVASQVQHVITKGGLDRVLEWISADAEVVATNPALRSPHPE